MKFVVFGVCVVALAGWAGAVTLVNETEGENEGVHDYIVAGPETLAVADSGYLFMYGNEITRPFVFTAERDTVRINGIPYRPRLRHYKVRVDGGWAPPEPSPERDNLMLRVRDLGERLLAQGYPYSDVVDSIALALRVSPLVESAQEGAIAVSVKFKDVNGFLILGIPVTPRPRVREWEEIWVETKDDIPTQYAVILMQPYDVLEEQVTDLDVRLYEQGIGYEARIQAMADVLGDSELVDSVDAKPDQRVINIYYKGIPGSYALGVGEDPTARPLYLKNPEEARRIALQENRKLALRLAMSLSHGAVVIIGPGDLSVEGPDGLRYLEAARRVIRGENTEEDLDLLRGTVAQRLRNPLPLEGSADDE